ncbi:hypothetical protein C7U65_24030 [Bradyrhizobium sp. WBAH23]|nr:hypothetical protein [Bradyrhizobium sp. WBAH30]MDD1545445.1 hypothetical protein [Bradyrhizobium sp. WBAH41]MDD1558670.1 hypothetical protein [Bradyrhizobium sp. WBAH23]MDD1568023.1 hypothetical protein [Bradyrhizobium sp. WBAH33]MDD1593064.1 hypothetical protein [Bradyrhizobium sp. WBAH42]NRB90452.1 hypothetical protein [Bradyrhizobium sp. WBAH10]
MGEGGAKRRMRGMPPQIPVRVGLVDKTPHPSRRFAASHPLPQGERGRGKPLASYIGFVPRTQRSASSAMRC